MLELQITCTLYMKFIAYLFVKNFSCLYNISAAWTVIAMFWKRVL